MPLGLFVGLGVSVTGTLCVRVTDGDVLGEAAEEPVTDAVLVAEPVTDAVLIAEPVTDAVLIAEPVTEPVIEVVVVREAEAVGKSEGLTEMEEVGDAESEEEDEREDVGRLEGVADIDVDSE